MAPPIEALVADTMSVSSPATTVVWDPDRGSPVALSNMRKTVHIFPGRSRACRSRRGRPTEQDMTMRRVASRGLVETIHAGAAADKGQDKEVVSLGEPKNVIEVDSLVKRYDALTAVDGVSFDVLAGEVFGMVGPNGAGKTTTVECIEGLRQPDQGTVRVLGMRPGVDHYSLAERIGIQFQADALPLRIRVGEALDLFSSFYSSSLDWRELLDRMGLSAKERSPFATLSGGQKQRLFIALALVNNPDLVFLDEPTTGLDPQSRRAMWDMVRDIRARDKTVFLTTHSMEEAERLCDRVAIMDHGKIVALDSPDNLIAALEAEIRVVFRVEGQMDSEILSGISGVTCVEQRTGRVVVHGIGSRLLSRVVLALESSEVSFGELRTEEPGLEDVFLALTGRKMRN